MSSRRMSSPTTSTLMNRIVRFQERGALLREIATAIGASRKEIHREIMRWLRLREKGK